MAKKTGVYMPQKKTGSSPSPAAKEPLEAPPEWAWYLQALDQKLDLVRQKTEAMIERFHHFEMQHQNLEHNLQKEMFAYKTDLQELDQSLQYLSHKTQMQLKESDKNNEKFMLETEKKVSDIHFATREELFSLSRRVEILEKLIF